MADPTADYLELADWRRTVAAMWEAWRRDSARDPGGATASFRAARDALFRDHPQSPLPAPERAAFGGLAYWPYDPAWRMTVRLEAETDEGALSGGFAGTSSPFGPIELPNSGADVLAFRRVGRVTLRGPLEGERLSVFWIEGYGGGLFLPFRDATSGDETYGAGRYLLDTIKGADHGGDPARGELLLDFNQAYHPSCAYDPRWSCPLAPPENRLGTPVKVGERLR